MGTSTLASLAELKMHIRSEHQEKSTKIRMKHLFGHRSKSSLPHTTPISHPEPPDLNSGPTITLSTEPIESDISGSSLRHIIPDDAAESESEFIGMAEGPISLVDLFDFNNNHWVNVYDGYAQRHVTEELALCELLNQDAATDEGAEVDVDDMTEDILIQ
jgi:hypothetical protein